MDTRTVGERVRLWVVAVRAYAYPASVVPVVLGCAYAWLVTGRFHWGLFLLALLAGTLYHTGCNLINDYYDFKHKVDREGTYGGSGVLLAGKMSPREILAGAYVCLALGTSIGLYFVYYFSAAYLLGWPILLLGVAGLLGAVFYTTTPLSAKYAALGEPLVFLMMGVGMVQGGYFIQAATLSWNAVWISLPVGFIVTAILQANDTRDIADDRQAGIRTLAILLGPTGARALLSILLFAPYVTVLLLALLKVAPYSVLLPWLTLPLALQLHQLHWRERAERSGKLRHTPEKTAKLHLAFGLLLSLGVVLGRWLLV